MFPVSHGMLRVCFTPSGGRQGSVQMQRVSSEGHVAPLLTYPCVRFPSRFISANPIPRSRGYHASIPLDDVCPPQPVL